MTFVIVGRGHRRRVPWPYHFKYTCNVATALICTFMCVYFANIYFHCVCNNTFGLGNSCADIAKYFVIL